MIKERTFSLVLVDTKNGIGLEPSKNSHDYKYEGNAVKIVLK
jgi:hypothetical protein